MEDAVQRHGCSSSSASSSPSVHLVAAQLQVHNLIEPHLPFAFRGAMPLPGCRRSLPAAKPQARRRRDLIRSNGGDDHGAKYWGKRDEALILPVKSNGGDGHGAEYWGKWDEALILPVNDIINVILDPDHLSATPTVTASPSFPSDRMWLNGKEIALLGGRFLHV